MRKTWLTFLLMCLMVLAQAGSLAHEISHYSGAVTVQQASQGDQTADGVCSLCLAFAGLSAFARPVPPQLPLVAAMAERLAAPALQDCGRRVARGRNRDPPAAA